MQGPDIENTDLPDGTHQLAAVMFTDIVGFSSRAHSNEAETLRLVARDLRRIKEVAEKHHGRVLKTLGDGVLIHFHSATDAVRCGMEFQTSMQLGFGPDKEKSPLQHRVGIHLGDMYVSESEVMGDGVNIASRLQTIAEPGGICVSQTVYDIIKHKVALKATHLGPKELKNISHAVNVYKIVIGAIEDTMDMAGPVARQPALSWRARGKILWEKLLSGRKGQWVRTVFLNPKTAAAALVLGVIACLLLAGSFLMASKETGPSLRELTNSQVEKALEGNTVNLGKILFVSTKGEIRRKDILSLKRQETTWEKRGGYFRSTYVFRLRVRGGSESYQAVIDHDGNQKVLKAAISGPL